MTRIAVFSAILFAAAPAFADSMFTLTEDTCEIAHDEAIAIADIAAQILCSEGALGSAYESLPQEEGDHSCTVTYGFFCTAAATAPVEHRIATN